MDRSEGPSGDDEPDLGRALGFMRLLWAVDHGLEALSKRMEAQLGVTGPQRLFLRIVGRFPGSSAGRVAEILEVHPSTLTGILRRLEKRKLVVRTEDPLDGRRALLSLTREGAAIDAVRTGTVEAAVKRVLRKASAADVAATERLLRSVAAELARGD